MSHTDTDELSERQAHQITLQVLHAEQDRIAELEARIRALEALIQKTLREPGIGFNDDVCRWCGLESTPEEDRHHTDCPIGQLLGETQTGEQD